MFWFWFVLIAVGLFAVVWLWRFVRDGRFVVRCFRKANCIVSGHKGNGKDLLFMYVIHKRGERHYSNIRYNALTEVQEPKTFNIDPNTYKDFLNGSVTLIEKNLKEGRWRCIYAVYVSRPTGKVISVVAAHVRAATAFA